MRILVACEESQAVTIELRRLGHEAYSCDIEPCSGGHPEWHINGDCLPILNGCCDFQTMDKSWHQIDDRWDMIIAFPPCTHLCCAGQRWFKSGHKDYALQEEAKRFFLKIANAMCEKIAIENPVGIMSTHYRKPDQIIHPWMFGDTDNKKTCIWLKGLRTLSSTEIVPVEKRTNNNWKAFFDGKQYGWNDPIVSKLRSRTYQGVARAMAEQWAGKA